MRDIYARTVQFSDEDRRERIAGLLGFDFIASVVLRIDYEHGLLDAYDSGTFQSPNGTTSVDLRLDDQVPTATLRVGRSTGDDFLVDTGASTTLLLFAHFARAHPHDVADDGVGASLAASGIGVAAGGIGGRIVIHPVRVKRVRLGATTSAIRWSTSLILPAFLAPASPMGSSAPRSSHTTACFWITSATACSSKPPGEVSAICHPERSALSEA